MERAEVLILKLQEQYRKKEPVNQILMTLQLLQQELLKTSAASAAGSGQKRKVSVVMPFPSAKDFSSDKEVFSDGEKILEVLNIDENDIEHELEEIKKAAELKNELTQKYRQPVQSDFDPLEEVPTLSTYSPVMDKPKYAPQTKNSTAEAGTEINDKVKPKAEISQKLQDVPIRDLRKAIGINDRYLFINELFTGDEAMFERSVKTLNQFSILPEAEFWMQRELKLKLAWNEDSAIVQQFVQLVRRRFS